MADTWLETILNRKDVKGFEDLAEPLAASLIRLLMRDRSLLQNGCSERSITHRLALYLELSLAGSGWDVDCEYNRNGHDTVKALRTIERDIASGRRTPKRGEGDLVYPDIIVHHRGLQGSDHNLLVIEAKCLRNSWDGIHGAVCRGDRKKLRAFADELGYRSTLLLGIGSGARYPDVELDFDPFKTTRRR